MGRATLIRRNKTNDPHYENGIHYASSDGKPMAESDLHRKIMAYAIDSLERHFAPRAGEVYVSGDNFLYYQKDNPRRFVSPDGYVIFGVNQEPRLFYKTWQFGDQGPDFVWEITSKSTKDEDIGKKFKIYEQTLGVPEYFLFDPTADYIAPRLTGYRLVNGAYVRLKTIEHDDGDRLFSEQLKLFLVEDGARMRWYDPVLDYYLPSMDEYEQMLVAESRRAEDESLRAEREACRAETEAQRAESEARRADAAEAEIARLRVELLAARQTGTDAAL